MVNMDVTGSPRADAQAAAALVDQAATTAEKEVASAGISMAKVNAAQSAAAQAKSADEIERQKSIVTQEMANASRSCTNATFQASQAGVHAATVAFAQATADQDASQAKSASAQADALYATANQEATARTADLQAAETQLVQRQAEAAKAVSDLAAAESELTQVSNDPTATDAVRTAAKQKRDAAATTKTAADQAVTVQQTAAQVLDTQAKAANEAATQALQNKNLAAQVAAEKTAIAQEVAVLAVKAQAAAALAAKTATDAAARLAALPTPCLPVKRWGAGLTIVLGLIVVLIAWLGVRIPFWDYPIAARFWTYIGIITLLTLFIGLTGYGITGRGSGLLIDDRNQISLSRLQMILWTVVVLSGLLTAALQNVSRAYQDPASARRVEAKYAADSNPKLSIPPGALDIAIPQELWLAMGISVVSLIGSPLVLSTKKGDKNVPDPEQKSNTLALMDQQGVKNAGNAPADGVVIVKNCPEDAQYSDIFRGEETGNGAHLDLAKIQMFFFTLVLVLGYATGVGAQLLDNTEKMIFHLPPLSSGMVALLGISHAGYLTNKAIPHSQTK